MGMLRGILCWTRCMRTFLDFMACIIVHLGHSCDNECIGATNVIQHPAIFSDIESALPFPDMGNGASTSRTAKCAIKRNDIGATVFDVH